MSDCYKIATTISSHIRALGYDVYCTTKKNCATFYLNNDFLFWVDLSIVSSKIAEEMVLEVIKEKTDVLVHSKNRKV